MRIKTFTLGVLILYSTIIGGVVGLLTWSFLTLVTFTTHFLWNTLPSSLNIKYWTIIMGFAGGILVGLCQKYFGNYPRKMDEVMDEFKTTKRVDYKSLPKSVITALSVLSFGASLGPEAALVGVIGGLSTWAGDVIKSIIKKKRVINEYGDIIIEYSIEATIGMIFNAPLVGLATFFQDKDDLKIIKQVKAIVYSITTASGFGVFILLSKIDNRSFPVPDFGTAAVGKNEILAIIPLILVGVLFALLYEFFGSMLHEALMPLEGYKVIRAVIGGLVLGVIGTLLPLTLFSGEHQITELAAEWGNISIYLLLLLGIVKLFITEFCLATGWRGGHIFPVIFAGVSIGYAISAVTAINPAISVVIVTTSLTSAVLKKPLATVLVLLLLFPIKLVVLMVLAAYLPIYLLKFKSKMQQQKN